MPSAILHHFFPVLLMGAECRGGSSVLIVSDLSIQSTVFPSGIAGQPERGERNAMSSICCLSNNGVTIWPVSGLHGFLGNILVFPLSYS
jgi:hypothetical protein